VCVVDSRGSEQGYCKHGNEHSGSIDDGALLDYLSDYQLLNKDLFHRVSLVKK
jgi:hypothetical protein